MRRLPQQSQNFPYGLQGVVQLVCLIAGGLVGMHVENSDETVATRYPGLRRGRLPQGPPDANGLVLERLSYDAWGKQRFPNGVDDPAGVITSQTSRGFTGHEELDSVALVHMNGRVYDPLLARFGTPDPMTENPFSTQGWNRYSYVGNSPLNFTDPSGYCFMGCFWQSIFKGIQNLFRSAPILGSILQIAAAYVCGPPCAALAAAFVTGVTSGDLGKALRAGFIAAVTAAAFFGVGELTGGFGVEGGVLDAIRGGHGPLDFGSPAHLFNIAGHALVGCGSAVASGGKCGPGALSGAVGSFAGPLMTDLAFEAKLVATSVVGGLASVAGGGKFANGAVTAAFGYLFNEAGEGNRRHEIGRQAAMRDAIDQGYTIVSADEVRVTLPGLPSRVYDFVIFDPDTGRTIGVEVKTTLFKTIFLNRQQVDFDVAVAEGLLGPAIGRAPIRVSGVAYYTYCGECWGISGSIRSHVLSGNLWSARIPVYPMRRLQF